MQLGGIKGAAAKRTVFADVSNTTRQSTAKDDPQGAGKKKGIEILKDSAVSSTQEAAQTSALLRPAQRPLANAASKANASNGAEPVASTAQKHVTLDVGSQAANGRKITAKKSTTVFKEPHTDPIFETTLAPVPTRHALPSRATSFQNVERASAQTSTMPADDINAQPYPTRKVEKVSMVDLETQDAVTRAEVEEKHEYLDALEEQARVIEQERNEEIAKSQALSGLDREEYWDEDEEEEYYDADGYTTARSLRSRCDNTTGGVTLVLAPRVTAKTQRELEAAKLFVEANRSDEDVEDEQWDTSMVAEYGDEIFEYMHSLEERMKPNATYMDHQAEIQWSMRSVLMDWLVQVHNRFTLLPETLFLAVNYVDRFLSCKVVSLGKLQLVGATALFVAAKYEEINCPSVQEIVYMVDGAYTADEVLKAERFMLSMLQFELGWPGPMSFLRRISKADDYDLETRTLAKYFLEITVMDERFVGCVPSFLSAGAHALARFMLKKGDWVCCPIILIARIY